MFDFRHCDITHEQRITNNDHVEISETFNYIGVVTIDNELT